MGLDVVPIVEGYEPPHETRRQRAARQQRREHRDLQRAWREERDAGRHIENEIRNQLHNLENASNVVNQLPLLIQMRYWQIGFPLFMTAMQIPMARLGAITSGMVTGMAYGLPVPAERFGEGVRGYQDAAQRAFQEAERTTNPLLREQLIQFGNEQLQRSATIAQQAVMYLPSGITGPAALLQQQLQRQMMAPALAGNPLQTMLEMARVTGQAIRYGQHMLQEGVRQGWIVPGTAQWYAGLEEISRRQTMLVQQMSMFADVWLARYPMLITNVPERQLWRTPTLEGVAESVGILMGRAGVTAPELTSQLRELQRLGVQPDDPRYWAFGGRRGIIPGGGLEAPGMVRPGPEYERYPQATTVPGVPPGLQPTQPSQQGVTGEIVRAILDGFRMVANQILKTGGLGSIPPIKGKAEIFYPGANQNSEHFSGNVR